MFRALPNIQADIARLIEWYLSLGDIESAIILAYLATSRKCVSFERLKSICREVLGKEPDTKRILSKFVQWRTRRIIENCAKGQYKLHDNVKVDFNKLADVLKTLLIRAPRLTLVPDFDTVIKQNNVELSGS